MTQIQNAKTTPIRPATFILVGDAGTGKTVAGLTLPRPTLFIMFDPSGAAALQGHDVDIVSFLPDGVQLEIKTGKRIVGKDYPTATAFDEFQAWFNKANAEKQLDKYKSIVVDSVTSLEGIITDAYVSTLNKQHQYLDNQEDAPNIRDHTLAVLRAIVALRKYIVINVHKTTLTDRSGSVRGYQMNVIGKARQILPTMVSNIFYMKNRTVGKNTKYLAITSPDGLVTAARTSFQGLETEIDLTIENWEDLTSQGLGKLIKKYEEA